ncbi:amino acid adenylation domain-containing protein [Calothrix brevissima NIES-22]|nr:amino acid adenylation domain-containing protein [Calothrix brevissima NIES-22]
MKLATGLEAVSSLALCNQELARISTLLSLPSDRPKTAIQSFKVAQSSFKIALEIAEALSLFSNKERVTLFITLLAVFKTLLYRYTWTEDILVGSPIVNSEYTFVDNLILYTNISEETSFQELLQRVHKVALTSDTTQDFYAETQLEELQLNSNCSESPLFPVMFGLDNLPLNINTWTANNQATKCDLSLFLQQTTTGLLGVWIYNAELFDVSTIERMSGHFQTLLASIVTNPKQPISQLTLLTVQEQQQLLYQWNDTQIDYPQDKCIHQLFEEQVERTPDAIAVVFEDKQITYQQLNSQANQLANYLRNLGVGPDVLVGIRVERSLEMIVGLLGILKAGGAYVPLDPNYPRERLAYMLANAQLSILLTQQQPLGGLKEQEIVVVCFDTDWGVIASESEENPVSEVTPENLAYVIYTSGSTGMPKGVAIKHHSVLNLATGLNNAIYTKLPQQQLRVSLNGSLSFDTSVKQWIQLLYGHTLDIIPQMLRFDGNALLAYLRSHKIDVLDCTPSQLELLIGAGLLLDNIPQCALVGGEAIAPSTWEALSQSTNINVYNVYGPTECTVDATLCNLRIFNHKPIIGRPISNTQIYILDRNLQLVPVGVPGEIYIGGAGLAKGYLHRPDLTQERFIPNPFSNDAESRLYKTGDLARYLNDGNIEYLGRIDHQVKIRGFRIELGEIAAVLSQHPTVAQTIINVYEPVPGDQRLVAYIVPTQGQKPPIRELRQFLSQKLPDFMVPSAFTILDVLPLTPNGKVDRQALPKPDLSRLETEAAFVAPRNQVEQQLTQIWEQVLGIQPISIKDNFFELGGHSLLAVKLFAQIQEQWGKNLPLATLFQASTVEALANIISQAEDSVTTESNPWSSLVAIQPHGSKPPFFCIHGLGGEVLCFRQLALHLGADQPLYGLQPIGLDGKQSAHTTVEDMASHYIQQIKHLQPQGPYFFGGYSFGGIVAFEMAQQLHKQGEQVGILVMFDTCLAGYSQRLSFWQRIFEHINNTLQQGPAYLWQKARGWSQWGKYYLQSKYKTFLEATEDLPPTDKHLEIININTQALNQYKFQVYPGRMTLLRTEDRNRDDAVGMTYDPQFGWGDLVTGGLDIHFVSGSHLSLFDEPHVQVLAEKLRSCLPNPQGNGVLRQRKWEHPNFDAIP